MIVSKFLYKWLKNNFDIVSKKKITKYKPKNISTSISILEMQSAGKATEKFEKDLWNGENDVLY